jgi:hypothetical protein
VATLSLHVHLIGSLRVCCISVDMPVSQSILRNVLDIDSLPWPFAQVEKFRPLYVKDIVGNKDAVDRLQVISEEGNMPNIILAVRPLLVCTLIPALTLSACCT